MSHTEYDAIVVGGGHNGLVAAGYLAKGGLSVIVLEARDVVGGPAANVEFLPGYRTSFANSPGSFERSIIDDLDLHDHGLRFLRPDPTLVHHFPGGAFLGWRDQARIDEQLEHWAAGESTRYRRLLRDLEALGAELGVSLFQPSPTLDELDARMSGSAQRGLFNRVFHGSLTELLDTSLRSPEAKALLAMLALNGNLLSPDAPGSAIGLMMRPISMASSAASDITASPLRGSSGLPIGGMGAVIAALVTSLQSNGGKIQTNTRVARILHNGRKVTGVTTTAGDEYRAPIVISAASPWATVSALEINDLPPTLIAAKTAVENARPTGSAFKIVLALDGQAEYTGLPDGVRTADVNGTQFRIGPSLDYIRQSVHDGLDGRATHNPIMWGLLVSATSPNAAPAGRELLSINVWHAPYDRADGAGRPDHGWDTAAINEFGSRCVGAITQLIPGLEKHIVAHRYLGPVEIAEMLDLPGSNITHGDMTPANLFGTRPHPALAGYRTPIDGLFLGGSGSWPGGYLTGVPGRNASALALADARRGARE